MSEQTLFNLSVDLFCTARDGYFQMVNPAWTKTLGWSEEELKAVPYINFVHPDDVNRTATETDRVAAGIAALKFENRYRTKWGSYRWLQWNSWVHDGIVAAVARDVTDQKEHHFQIDASRREAEYFKYFVENTLDPLYLISPTGGFRFVYVNQAACTHFGLSREKLLTMSIPDWDPQFTDKQCELFWAELKQKKIMVVQTEHRRSDGKILPVEVWANYIQLGTEEMIAGVFHDITDRRIAEREMERFSYAVAHDLQEPLRTINSYLQLLRIKIPLTPEIKEYIDFTTDAAKRMITLIRSVLDYSHLGKAKELELSCDLNDIVDSAIKALSKKIEEVSASITVDPLPSLMGNSSLLSQLFQNLIENALKYRSTERPLGIHVYSEAKHDGWVITVEDNGIGIKTEYREKIFGAFERLHSRSAIPGVGLGLATCKKVMEIHGGRIWVHSTEGKGSRFICFFPKRISQEARRSAYH